MLALAIDPDPRQCAGFRERLGRDEGSFGRLLLLADCGNHDFHRNRTNGRNNYRRSEHALANPFLTGFGKAVDSEKRQHGLGSSFFSRSLFLDCFLCPKCQEVILGLYHVDLFFVRGGKPQPGRDCLVAGVFLSNSRSLSV